jgi:hypothetical protein
LLNRDSLFQTHIKHRDSTSSTGKPARHFATQMTARTCNGYDLTFEIEQLI